MRNFILALFISLLGFGAFALAHDEKIEITKAWARATSAGQKTGGAYVTLVNPGHEDDRLLGAATPIAGKVELHRMVMEGNVMKMLPLADVPVKSGATVEFKPGAMHIMLLDLSKPLGEGDSFPLTLTFEKAGAVAVTVTVVKPGASDGPATHDMGSMPGMKM